MPGRQHQDNDLTSLFVVAASLLRGRWRIIRWTILSGAVAALVATLRPVTYSASASFVPQASDASVPALASLAGQFGVSLSGGSQSRSPDFYRSLLTTDALLDAVAGDTFRVDELNGRQVSLLDLLEIGEDLPTRRLEKGRSRLGSLLETSVDNSTGVVSLSVATEWPSVSLAIITALVDGVQAFNQRVRQDEAAAERVFIEARLKVVSDELRSAEDTLELFLMTNRQFQGSPELVFRHDRLEREVLSRQQVLTSLTQSYEEARIREVRNTPVITIVEAPSVPALADPRRRVLLGMVGLLLGACVGVAGALASTTVTHHRDAGDADAETLLAAVEELKGDLRSPAKWVRGLLRG